MLVDNEMIVGSYWIKVNGMMDMLKLVCGEMFF